MTSADFTIVEFLAWVRTKPAGERYDFFNPKLCAIGQFGAATDRHDLTSIGITYLSEKLPNRLSDAVVAKGSPRDWTFGALAARLEALCPETPVNASNWQAIDAYLNDIEDVARERCSA
jgi:hypothetical protein